MWSPELYGDKLHSQGQDWDALLLRQHKALGGATPGPSSQLSYGIPRSFTVRPPVKFLLGHYNRKQSSDPEQEGKSDLGLVIFHSGLQEACANLSHCSWISVGRRCVFSMTSPPSLSGTRASGYHSLGSRMATAKTRSCSYGSVSQEKPNQLVKTTETLSSYRSKVA